MKRIRCVHQGYELYGSDRTFISCVSFLRERYPDHQIEVLLPKKGPLSDALIDLGFTVVFRDLWVLRKGYGSLRLALRATMLPFYVLRTLSDLKPADVLYINTGVIVDHLLAACIHRRTVIHVHEIPGDAARRFVRFFVGLPRVKVLFNSFATKRSLSLPATIPQTVVSNGVDMAPQDDVGLPEGGPSADEPIHLLMIGRINSWKGQDLLVDALALLPETTRRQLSVRVVGDVFEGAPFRDDLVARVADRGLGDLVEIQGFQPDPSSSYRWSHVVVVPSRLPEPFGLVAIEAMAYGRPVIAARHGGLTEIVEDQHTGFLHRPNDAEDLARILQSVVDRRVELRRIGEAGRVRYHDLFTLAAFKRNFLRAMSEEIDDERKVD